MKTLIKTILFLSTVILLCSCSTANIDRSKSEINSQDIDGQEKTFNQFYGNWKFHDRH